MTLSCPVPPIHPDTPIHPSTPIHIHSPPPHTPHSHLHIHPHPHIHPPHTPTHIHPPAHPTSTPPTPTTKGLLFQALLKLLVLFLQLLLLPLPLLRHLVHQHLHLDQLLLQHQHIVSTRPGRNRGKEVIQATASKMKCSFFTFCNYTLLASTL